MTTKVKTTATFTFTFESESEEMAIRSLRSWFQEKADNPVQLVKDSDTKEYTYLDTESHFGCTFRFRTPAEFIEKYSRDEGAYVPVRAMLDYSKETGVTATVETIEVEEEK